MAQSEKKAEKLHGARVLILIGNFRGQEGICLGQEAAGNRWAISPHDSDEILFLVFERDFGLLLDLQSNPRFD